MPARLRNNTVCPDETINLDDSVHLQPIDNALDHDSSPRVAVSSTSEDGPSDGSLWIGLTCGLLAFVALSAVYYYVKTKRPNLLHRPNLK